MKKLFLLLLFIPFVSFGQSAEDYFNSGQLKGKLQDYSGALSDFNKAIELDPNYDKAYYNRGKIQVYLNNYYDANEDYTKCIEVSSTKAVIAAAYVNRGLLKADFDDISGACLDWIKAANLGNAKATKMAAQYCNFKLIK